MLILSRKIQQNIIINDNIQICILSIDGRKVSLGIKAPRDIPIYREELYRHMNQKIYQLFNSTGTNDYDY
jgi:carbon storage regulator